MTEKSLNELTIGEFLDKLASRDPVPGGGTAAALTGAVAAALSAMVARTTLGKKKYSEVHELMEDTAEKADSLRRELVLLGKADEDAFRELMSTVKLPKETDEERKYRKEKLEKAMLRVTEIPMQTARKCAAIAELASLVLKSGNQNARSDAHTALALAASAFSGAAATVRINLSALDKETAAEFLKQLQTLSSKIEELTKSLQGVVQS